MQAFSNKQTCALSQFQDQLICRNVRVIGSLDCCHHFLLVEGVRHHLSLVAKTQYTMPPWCHGEAGVRLQSPSSCHPSIGSTPPVSWTIKWRERARWVMGRECPLIVPCRERTIQARTDTVRSNASTPCIIVTVSQALISLDQRPCYK